MGTICSWREIQENTEEKLIANKDPVKINIDQDMLLKLKQLEKNMKNHLNKVIKIQSTYRMFVVHRLFQPVAISRLDLESIAKKSLRSLKEITTEFRGLSKYKYFGKKVDSKKQGFGIIKWSANSKFSGNFVNDKAHGLGKLRHENYFYSGEFREDKANGYGFCIGADKIEYEGYWRDENLAGIGLERFEGNIYEGDYYNGQKQGLGKYIWKDGSEYQGEWDDNIMQGWGIYHFSNGGLYMGEFNQNMMSGYGEYVLNNKTFIGMFLNDNRHGFGIDYIVDPIKIYVGFWKDGKKDGLGKFLSEDSVSFCFYENGKKTKIIQNYSDAALLIPKNYSRFKNYFKFNLQKLMKIKERD